MSSWQGYIETSLVGTGHVSEGLIFGAAGDSVWASSEGLTPTEDELKQLADVLAGNEGAKDKMFADGMYLAGVRYVVARAEDRSLYARSGRTGIAAAKTKQVIIVGRHGEAQVAGNASSAVEGLADYLIGQGY